MDAVPGGDDRLITGMGFERSAIVKTNNDLYYCTPGCAFVSGNWQARLITGLDCNTFAEVEFDGRPAKWTRNGSA